MYTYTYVYYIYIYIYICIHRYICIHIYIYTYTAFMFLPPLHLCLSASRLCRFPFSLSASVPEGTAGKRVLVPYSTCHVISCLVPCKTSRHRDVAWHGDVAWHRDVAYLARHDMSCHVLYLVRHAQEACASTCRVHRHVVCIDMSCASTCLCASRCHVPWDVLYLVSRICRHEAKPLVMKQSRICCHEAKPADTHQCRCAYRLGSWRARDLAYVHHHSMSIILCLPHPMSILCLFYVFLILCLFYVSLTLCLPSFYGHHSMSPSFIA